MSEGPLTALQIKLLSRGASFQFIGLSDRAPIQAAEIAALIKLERMGFVRKAATLVRRGPPSPTPFEITDAGIAALVEIGAYEAGESK